MTQEFTEQELRCIRGDHEGREVLNPSVTYLYINADGYEAMQSTDLRVCRNCGVLYAPFI